MLLGVGGGRKLSQDCDYTQWSPPSYLGTFFKEQFAVTTFT